MFLGGNGSRWIATGFIAAVSLIVCCGFPSYEVGREEPLPRDANPVPDVVAYDVPSATCDGGFVSGQAVACACSDADSGDTDVSFGNAACTVEGGLGSCVGCPETTSCEGVISPLGTICVPGGTASLGATNSSVCPGGCALEGPEHPVTISRMFVEEHEVTVRRFRDWWTHGHVTPVEGTVLFVAGDGTEVVWRDLSISEPVRDDGKNGATWLGPDDGKHDSLPINFVDWPTALAFCAANGERLPTEAEWEFTASGREARIFPLAPPGSRNDPPTMLPCDEAISSVSDCGAPNTQTFGTHRHSVDGVYDLAGGLAEWVLDVEPPGGISCTTNCYPASSTVDPILYVASVDARGVRGGSFIDTDPKLLRAQARTFKPLATKTKDIGFRCVRR